MSLGLAQGAYIMTYPWSEAGYFFSKNNQYNPIHLYEIFDAYACLCKFKMFFLNIHMFPKILHWTPRVPMYEHTSWGGVFSKEVLICFNFSMTFIKIIQDYMGQINTFL